MKHREINGEWVCACDPICDNCERRFRCLDAGPANSILQGKGSAPRRFDTIAEKPLIAAQMLALDQERERVEEENAKLRELLSYVYEDLKQGAMPNYDDPWFNAARAALKE